MDDGPLVPVRVRVHLAHAVLQAVADKSGADVLHIKGPSIDPALLGGAGEPGHPKEQTAASPARPSSADADLMVRPDHLARLMASLQDNGWIQVTPFLDHGLVQHSTVWFHPQLGQADVHYRFPGMGIAPQSAFNRLWRDRQSAEIAHRRCTVPSVTAQRLILLLHAARDPVAKWGDVERVWAIASPTDQENVLTLAGALRAEVALAAATGNLEDFRGRREYQLWKLYVDGNSSSGGFAKLVALSQAAPEGYEHVRLRVVRHAIGAFFHAPQRLAAGVAHRPTAREISRDYGRLFRRGLDIFKGGGGDDVQDSQ